LGRRGDALGLALESIQQREEHWGIADLVSQGGHIPTVPIPEWGEDRRRQRDWTAGLTHGGVFRAMNRAGRVWGDG